MSVKKSLTYSAKTSLFLIFTFCILHFNCHAAPCYGAKMPQKEEFFAGLQTHAIFKRYLENEYGKLRSVQHFLLLSYGIFDWLSIDLKGGAGNIKQHPIGNDEVDYVSNFAGGYGFRLRLYPVRNTKAMKEQDKISNGVYDHKDIKMVFGFQHISAHPKSARLGDNKNQAILDDWQASISCSYDFKKITPYFGTRWSRIDYIHKINADRKRKMSDLTKGAGFIFGFDLPLTKKAWINLEGSILDSEALAFSLNYSF